MKRKMFVLTVVVLCLFNSCKSKEDNIIRIGAILPLTGYSAVNAKRCQVGLQLAIDELNKHQTQYKFEVLYEDSRSSAKDGFMAYRKLKSNNVKYFIGFGGQFVLGFAPETNDEDVILFALGTPNMNILNMTNRCFRIYPNVEMFVDKICDFLSMKDITKVGVIYLQNEAYAMFGELFKNRFEKEGNYVLSFEGYDASSLDFKDIINKLDKDIECIYVAGTGESTAIFARQLFSNPRTSHISLIGDMSLSTPDNIKMIGNVKSPIYFVDSYKTDAFTNLFLQSHEEMPNAFATYAYTIPFILYESLTQVNNDQDVFEIYSWIRQNKFDTAAGEISFQDNCEPNLHLVINTIETNE